jgi:hypothetical protein
VVVCRAASPFAPSWQRGVIDDRILCLGGPGDAGTSLPGDAGVPCEARPEVACGPPGPGAQSALDAQLSMLVKLCGNVPEDRSVSVYFADGCATNVVAGWAGSEGFEACLATELSAVRWPCALGLFCGQIAGPSGIL